MLHAKPGRSNPTIKDVAQLAGVSVATASRAMRSHASVRPEKVAAVEAAVAQLGYVPNSAARGLVQKKTGAIALIIPEREGRVFSDPFFGAIVSGIASVLDEHTYQLVLVMSGENRNPEKLRRFLRGNHCDGAVLASHHESKELREIIRETALPIVSLGAPLKGAALPFVDLDNEKGGRIAAQRLLEKGAREIAIIQGPVDMAASVDRVKGFCKVLQEAGLSPAAILQGDYSPESGARAIDELLESKTSFDAVFAANDLMALAAVGRLRGHFDAHTLPMVMGFDNIDKARAELAGLTTISNPVTDMGKASANLLIQLIESTPATESVFFQPKLVARTSA